jgi:hypothetical protein
MSRPKPTINYHCYYCIITIIITIPPTAKTAGGRCQRPWPRLCPCRVVRQPTQHGGILGGTESTTHKKSRKNTFLVWKYYRNPHLSRSFYSLTSLWHGQCTQGLASGLDGRNTLVQRLAVSPRERSRGAQGRRFPSGVVLKHGTFTHYGHVFQSGGGGGLLLLLLLLLLLRDHNNNIIL